MPEEGKDMEKDLGQKGGELIMSESDSLGEDYRRRDDLLAKQGRDRLARSSSPKGREAVTPRTVNGAPGNPDSVVPMNKNMVRHLPGKPGVYREIDSTGRIIKGSK